MLESISWQNFLTTIGLVAGSYYLASTLLLYNKEIVQSIKGKPSRSPNKENSQPEHGLDLLGKVRYDAPGMPAPTTISSEEISFQSSSAESPEISSAHKDTLLIGSIADFLHEAKALAEVVHGQSKEEAVILFKSLLARYLYLVGTHYQQALSIYIYTELKEQHGFDLQPQEVNTWWYEEIIPQ